MQDTVDPWEVIEALTTEVLREQPDVDACESRYTQVEERLLDAIHRSSRQELGGGYRRLRRLYERLAARAPDEYGWEVSYHLGRVVELTELAGSSVERCVPQVVTNLVGQPEIPRLLGLLQERARTSSELKDALDWGADTLSRRLDSLQANGLITSYKQGRFRVSSLTLLGEQVLQESGGAAHGSVPTAPRLEYWRKSGT